VEKTLGWQGPVNSRAMAIAPEPSAGQTSESQRGPKGEAAGGVGERAKPSRVLQAMLDRQFAAIMTGPAMNCRPHHSRQRIDLTAFGALQTVDAAEIVRGLVSDGAEVEIEAKVKPPVGMTFGRGRRSGKGKGTEGAEGEATVDQKQREEWNAQQQVLSKLRVIAEEAETYEQDTGVYILNVGFPLLSLPPGMGTAEGTASTKRILAPLAFMPVEVEITSGTATRVSLSCAADDIDRVHVNESLLAWVEQATGKAIDLTQNDERGEKPWEEICAITAAIAQALKLEVPEEVREGASAEKLILRPTPAKEDLGSDPTILVSGVIGLFPLANQGLLRDTKEMLAGAAIEGPVRSFLTVDPEQLTAAEEPVPQMVGARKIAEDRLVGAADPCQAQAVAQARTSPILVIHGPPGTGKSQTITNIIGDALIRGERVLFVCEKRTALDVVANRLGAVGLGDLCAVIHDPQRDQKTLYMSIRQQLEELTETMFDPKAAEQLEAADRELMRIHADLKQAYDALHGEGAGKAPSESLHGLIGTWLGLVADGLGTWNDKKNLAKVDLPEQGKVETREVEAAVVNIRDVLTRGSEIGYSTNPWREAAGLSINEFFARPMAGVRQVMAEMVQAGQAVDGATSEIVVRPEGFAEQAGQFEDLAASVKKLMEETRESIRGFWMNQSLAQMGRHAGTLGEVAAAAEVLRTAHAPAELLAAVRSGPSNLAPTAAACQAALAAIRAYAPIAGSWTRWFAFGKKRAAERALAVFGVPLTVGNLARGEAAYSALLAMHQIEDGLGRMGVVLEDRHAGMDVGATLDVAEEHLRAVQVRKLVGEMKLESAADGLLREMLGGSETNAGDVGERLQRACARARAMGMLREKMVASGLMNEGYVQSVMKIAAEGKVVGDALKALDATLDTLDDVLRIREILQSSSVGLADSLQRLAMAGVSAEDGLLMLRTHSLNGEISRRLSADATIRQIDPKGIGQLFERFTDLTTTRQKLCQERSRGRWIEAQRSRLLVGTGSKLNSLGAAIKTRLLVRGSNALRLRQVIAHGARTEGGDPLFDLRPVWMASPETVAQIFPRQPEFDVLIFDEASQLKLEDAIPVLTRAARIVIAGDPKQLPPTRFFESAATVSDEEPVENDQDLFESQQARAEDLLSAALSMNVDQAYLDVHYRSKNSDLIEFSNDNFYGGRLQAIPGHPSHRVTVPPLVLYEVKGVYAKSANPAEADQVVTIVRDLLKRATPPSIGIGCFNIVQRDLISERLDEAAEGDAEFAEKLAAARGLRRGGSFEGLFVKNLENVQGDERDHIIISTTYGPDEAGKFYRRFGPLLQPGGGRRLNVLVTRARQEIHLVTSIPRSEFTALPPIPANSQPGGGWLLFAYLKFALELQRKYGGARAILNEMDGVRDQSDLEVPPFLDRKPTKAPSEAVDGLTRIMVARGSHGGMVYWGNDGFAVDHAVWHDAFAERAQGQVSIGVQCDFSRFPLTQDRVEWDIFRSQILTDAGWKMQRVWTPMLFRDLDGQVEMLLRRGKMESERDTRG